MMMRETFNRRFSPNRRRTHVEAWFHRDTDTAGAGGRLRVTIRDVSYDGMRPEVEEALEPGTAGAVEVLGTRIPAIVHWWKNGQAGVHLAERLDRDLHVALEAADDDLADYR